MTESIKFLSYNCHGLNAVKSIYLREISSVYDFVLLQETWLYEDTNFFDKNLQGFSSYTISGMDASKVNYGRPYGGCAILWKEDLLVSVTPVSTSSNRLCGVIIKNFDYSILVFNVYMPCDSGCQIDNEQYSEILLEIAMLYEKSDVQYVVIGGDFNTDFSRNSPVCQRLRTFLTEECMCCVSLVDRFNIDYTFESMANGSKSLIDHFVVSEIWLNVFLNTRYIMMQIIYLTTLLYQLFLIYQVKNAIALCLNSRLTYAGVRRQWNT